MRISNIQVLRGLAAGGVVVAHAAGMLLYGGVPVSLPNLEWGAFGVDLFFVVSGVVMVVTSAEQFGRPGAALPFLGRRILRVVPLYWVASLAFAVLFGVGATAAGRRGIAAETLRAMLFVPGPDGATAPLPTAWTLFYEMFFYGCFALALPFRRRAALLLLGLALAALGAAGAAGGVPGRLGCVASLQLLEFVAGLAVGEAWLDGWRIPARAGTAVACAVAAYAVLCAPHMDGWTIWRGLAWGTPAALIVGALTLAAEPARRSRVRRALERLGDASYAVYLSHFPLFWAAGMLVPGLPRSGPHAAQLYVAGLVALGLCGGIAAHRFVEVPMARGLRRLARLAVRRVPGPAVAAA